MVGPIYIIAVALGMAFFMGFLGKRGINIAGTLMVSSLAFLSFVSLQWLYAFVFQGQTPEYIYTAGFQPPFSINLLMGMRYLNCINKQKDGSLFTRCLIYKGILI